MPQEVLSSKEHTDLVEHIVEYLKEKGKFDPEKRMRITAEVIGTTVEEVKVLSLSLKRKGPAGALTEKTDEPMNDERWEEILSAGLPKGWKTELVKELRARNNSVWEKDLPERCKDVYYPLGGGVKSTFVAYGNFYGSMKHCGLREKYRLIQQWDRARRDSLIKMVVLKPK
ncbi:hypothetical protein KW782_01010 [Candidatus Parcubacteria bacterium]|nr:hypothetical protein [Candidatus Parcubacteria bacterium]